MKTKAFSMLLAGMLLIALSPSTLVQAQSLHDWSTVQSIGVDERLIVKQKDGKTLEGKMIEATASPSGVTHLTFTRRQAGAAS